MNDITFSYNANFFLFATLENARPIAQGRVPQNPPAFPVLTGMPVSGMAYLDRPSPAGYFLFPDLSVRHEGKYRLGFTLYEEVKEAKDADAEPATNHPDHPANKQKMLGPLAAKAHVDWRLEVKSKPFTVFSAKKFPGLAESTALSRIVAEQGCRVRIRRDVRMRRRDKTAPDFEDFDDEPSFVRSRATPTPDPYHQATPIQPVNHAHGEGSVRPRSPSNGSVDAQPPYGLDPHRAALQEQTQYNQAQYPHVYPPGPAHPQAVSNGYPSHLSFGPANNQHGPPQYGPPGQNMGQQMQEYAQSHMGYFPPPQQQYNHQSSQSQHSRQGSADQAVSSRRGSVVYQQQPQPQPQPSTQTTPVHGYGYAEANYGRPPSAAPQYHSGPAPSPGLVPRTPTPGSNGQSLPPLKMSMPLPLEPKFDGVGSPAGPTPNSWATPAPPLPSPGYEAPQHRTGTYPMYPAPQAPLSENGRSAKRPYGSVFNTVQHEQSYRNGMRPNEGQVGSEPCQATYDEDDLDSAYELHQMKMQYKRADGTEISRRLPTTI